MTKATMRRRIERLEENMGSGEATWGVLVEWVARFRQGHSENDPAYLDFCRRWERSRVRLRIEEMIRQSQGRSLHEKTYS